MDAAQLRLDTSTRIAAPAAEADPLEWAASSPAGDAHLYPRPLTGFPPRAFCGVRWTVVASYSGVAHCATCRAIAEGRLAALSAALDVPAPIDTFAGDHHVYPSGVGR
jgi:hypothetical protein